MLAYRMRLAINLIGAPAPDGDIFNVFNGVPWSKYGSNPVLTKGAAATWDELGLRDPNMMIDENGYLVKESDNIIMYYSGYDDDASAHYRRAIGRATSDDGGITWSKYGSNPVLDKGAGDTWDEFGVQFASVVRRGASDYIMAYSGVNDAWSDNDSWGIGIATSTNGLSWSKHGSNPVLSKADFNGITGNNIVTFPYMIRLSNGTWAMLLVGTFGAGDVMQIYGATSPDALDWTPLNSGSAVFSPGGSGWDTDNIEGPRLYELGINKYLLSYHGDPGGGDNGKMKLLLATSTDLITWSRYVNNPVMEPSGSGWDDFRVENMVMAKDDFGTNTIRMWYSGAPASDGEDDGAIGYATSAQ